MIETHPFGIFIPPSPRYLLLGSFPALDKTKNQTAEWFYGSGVNQFWKILEEVYSIKLDNKDAKITLMNRLHIAMSDVIYSCERVKGGNGDDNLINITYNTELIETFLLKHPIEKIFFTSKFTEKIYRKEMKYLLEKFPHIKLIILPSPSPRYAAMKKTEKIKRYKELLPRF